MLRERSQFVKYCIKMPFCGSSYLAFIEVIQLFEKIYIMNKNRKKIYQKPIISRRKGQTTPKQRQIQFTNTLQKTKD